VQGPQNSRVTKLLFN